MNAAHFSSGITDLIGASLVYVVESAIRYLVLGNISAIEPAMPAALSPVNMRMPRSPRGSQSSWHMLTAGSICKLAEQVILTMRVFCWRRVADLPIIAKHFLKHVFDLKLHEGRSIWNAGYNCKRVLDSSLAEDNGVPRHPCCD